MHALPRIKKDYLKHVSVGRFLKGNTKRDINSIIVHHAKIYEEVKASLKLIKCAIYLEKEARLKSTEAFESNNL